MVVVVEEVVVWWPSADSLATRIMDAGARVLVTADGVYRGTKLIKLLEIAYSAMDKAKEGDCEVSTCFCQDMLILWICFTLVFVMQVVHHICVSHLGRLSSPGDLSKHKETTGALWTPPRSALESKVST